MSIIFQDTFTRANNTSSPGTPEIGGPYAVVSGVWGINNNSLYTSTSVSGARLSFPGSYNFDATWQLTTQAGTAAVGFMFRWIDASNSWMAYVSSGTMKIWHRANNVDSTIADIGAVAAGDVFRVVGKDKWLYFFVNGVLRFKVEDPHNPSASTMAFWFGSTTAGRIDNVVVDDTPPADMTDGVDGGASTLLDHMAVASDPTGTAELEEDVALASDVLVMNEAWLYKGRDFRADDLANIP